MDPIGSIPISLPYPSQASQPGVENLSKVEDVILTLSNGTNRTALLIRYDESESTLTIRYIGENEDSIIPLTEIKNFQLVNSRHFSIDVQGESSPDENKSYTLNYIDGTQEKIDTIGHVEDNNGVHLFVAQAFFNYYHMFVPFSAIVHKQKITLSSIDSDADKKSPTEQHPTKEAIKETIPQPTLSTFTQPLTIEEEFETKTQEDTGLDFPGFSPPPEAAIEIEAFSNTVSSIGELTIAIKRNESTPNMRLGEALIQENLITDSQLKDALEEQKKSKDIPLGEILVTMGAVTKNEMKKTLASKLGIPFVNLKRFNIDIEAINMVPEKICRRHNIIPLCLYDSKLVVAVENPLYRLPLEDLRFHTTTFIEAVMALPDEIENAISKHYGAQIDDIALALDDEDDAEDSSDIIAESDNALVKLVNKMIMDAYAQGASDIHIEPYPGKKKTLVRFRKDGELVPYVELPPSYRSALISRLKIMCDLDISERRKPQDGKINFRKYGPLNIELRVATLPTSGGLEDVVLRVLANGEPIPLDKMGIRDEYLKNIKDLINKPYGLFLVCGPTGSGKTTTLHSILGHINTPEKKIWTAEDPVEITQEGLRQVQVNTKIDLTFANAMRAFLRADPDVIMVGEMRDPETTSTGIEASLTGHLVFSTLHTNSATESIVRLLDMGMDPFNFADSLLGILAQRLAKRLCSKCKTSHVASDSELDELLEEYGADVFKTFDKTEKNNAKKKILAEWKERFSENGKLQIPQAEGCDECGDSGYSGRLALHELLISTIEIKKLIHEHATVADLGKQAFSQGMVTLKQDGIEKILQGKIDLLQVRAVCIK